MEKHKTVIGTNRLNEYVELGWKRIHVFTKPTEWDENGVVADAEPAFVIVWDLAGEPVEPKKRVAPNFAPVLE